MKTLLPLLVLGVAVVACGPKLTLEGARVQVAPSMEELSACQPVSAVDAVADSKEKAEIALRNKAGAMSADRVLISDTLEAGGEVKLLGKAFSCSSAETGGPAGE